MACTYHPFHRYQNIIRILFSLYLFHRLSIRFLCNVASFSSLFWLFINSFVRLFLRICYNPHPTPHTSNNDRHEGKQLRSSGSRRSNHIPRPSEKKHFPGLLSSLLHRARHGVIRPGLADSVAGLHNPIPRNKTKLVLPSRPIPLRRNLLLEIGRPCRRRQGKARIQRRRCGERDYHRGERRGTGAYVADAGVEGEGYGED